MIIDDMIDTIKHHGKAIENAKTSMQILTSKVVKKKGFKPFLKKNEEEYEKLIIEFSTCLLLNLTFMNLSA